jgi:hypothetical protein
MKLSSIRHATCRKPNDEGEDSMIVAIGAHSRKVGKTSIVCELLRATPEVDWTAVKISANRRGLAAGSAIEEETVAAPSCDTGRFLVAGAKRSIWIRAADSQMRAAAEAVERIVEHGGHTVIESNRIVEWLEPDLYALALDSSNPDFKESARRLFDRADAYIARPRFLRHPRWPHLPLENFSRKPVYEFHPPSYAPAGLIADLRQRLEMDAGEAAA